MLLIDLVLLLLLAIAIPAAWGIDTDAMPERRRAADSRRADSAASPSRWASVALAIVAFIVCIVLARLVRGIVRDRVLPTLDAPLGCAQSIDAG